MRYKLIKKGGALIIATVMFLSSIIGMNDNIPVVWADGYTEPELGYFATKSELMSSFDLDGTNDTVGTIKFGLGLDGTTQNWMIAGKDPDTTKGDNVVLFAASALLNNISYTIVKSSYQYSETWGCTYNTDPEQVSAYHYGEVI